MLENGVKYQKRCNKSFLPNCSSFIHFNLLLFLWFRFKTLGNYISFDRSWQSDCEYIILFTNRSSYQEILAFKICNNIDVRILQLESQYSPDRKFRWQIKWHILVEICWLIYVNLKYKKLMARNMKKTKKMINQLINLSTHLIIIIPSTHFDKMIRAQNNTCNKIMISSTTQRILFEVFYKNK